MPKTSDQTWNFVDCISGEQRPEVWGFTICNPSLVLGCQIGTSSSVCIWQRKRNRRNSRRQSQIETPLLRARRRCSIVANDASTPPRQLG